MNFATSSHRGRLRLALIAFSVIVGAFAWLAAAANPTDQFVARNIAPAGAAWLLLAWIVLRRPADARWWLGWAGFLVPALGLSGYLHLAFLNDWQGIASAAVTPALLFRFLPWYAGFAGGIGFGIGWIVGRAAMAPR